MADVKAEFTEAQIAETSMQVYQIAVTAKTGVSQKMIMAAMAQSGQGPNVNLLAASIGKLLRTGQLSYHSMGDEVIYTARDDVLAQAFKQMTPDEMVVYQLIKDEGNKGAWTKTLKIRSGLNQKRVSKIIATLMKRGLIKAVKSIAAKNRKMYMLSEYSPDQTLYGGPWYDDKSEFDSEFFQVLQKAVERYLGTTRGSSLSDIRHYVKSTNICKLDLTEENVLQIVQSLVYEGRVEEIMAARYKRPGRMDDTLYKLSNLTLPRVELTYVPCGYCPVSNVCTEDGDISPAKCIYLDQWLDVEDLEGGEDEDELPDVRDDDDYEDDDDDANMSD
mmetsp:Transcript_8399/g.23674  ORF Transcript_8399/g.23674 Transcript_8399/m.23674 type:complete len:332 (+) Transcript_8399:43-1038(+)